MEPDVLELESFLPYRLYRLADTVSREFSGIYKKRHGLTRPEWRTLSGLGPRSTMTAAGRGGRAAGRGAGGARAGAGRGRGRGRGRAPGGRDRRGGRRAL